METKREEIIRKWFSMWLSKEDGGILELFSPHTDFHGKLGTGISRKRKDQALVSGME